MNIIADGRPSIESIDLKWAYRLLNFGPLTLISSSDGQNPNVCSVAWCMPVSKDPPRLALALGTKHHSYKNMKRTKMLGINIPTQGLEGLALYCGRHSGAEVDKVREKNIALHQGNELTDLPLVSACAAWLECRYIGALPFADKELSLVEIVAASTRTGVLDANHAWNANDFRTLHHAGGERFLYAATE